MKQKKISFEDSLKRLEEIVAHLEEGDLPLEQSLALFEEGTALVKSCSALLDETEQKVLILRTGEDGTLSEEVFPGDRAE